MNNHIFGGWVRRDFVKGIDPFEKEIVRPGKTLLLHIGLGNLKQAGPITPQAPASWKMVKLFSILSWVSPISTLPFLANPHEEVLH